MVVLFRVGTQHVIPEGLPYDGGIVCALVIVKVAQCIHRDAREEGKIRSEVLRSDDEKSSPSDSSAGGQFRGRCHRARHKLH